ncbi:septation ring formation regulator EzrA [Guptibacillus algicola]|uniref:septation ring formation regulator EzrA n=1 Tax=Guptibacillus algicola TaxID=225844 RepID=UPI001CD3F823|nr:septation ring formation regulator EzrA [Alkalihalobacillus algicola]MCA0986372.1 septation ring formation regulator EzrA [Alkalihalobacillus algicola]
MEYIVIAIILMIAVFIYGAYARRKIFNEIDRLEEWKIDILNRPVTDEISKVKGLVMSGQTEEKFEKWREEWDEIVAVKLPNLEEQLMDIEEAAERYRFRKARAKLEETQHRLEHAEKRIELLLKDIDELVSSEEQNRIEITSVQEDFREAKQRLLSQNRSLGEAFPVLDVEVEELRDMLKSYEQLTEEGNYLEARDVLVEVQERLDLVQEKISITPEVIVLVNNQIPSQIKELEDGTSAMESEGYVLDHLEIDERIEEVSSELEKWKTAIETTEVQSIKTEIDAVRLKIEGLYDQLENEVEARHFVTLKVEELEHEMMKTNNHLQELQEESNVVQLSYRLEEQELKAIKELELKLSDLYVRFQSVQEAVDQNKQAYSLLAESAIKLKEDLTIVDEELKVQKENLHMLRKDELRALDTIKELKRKLIESKRLMKLSNIPGIPESYLEGYERAEDIIVELNERLSDVPLDIYQINQVLAEAERTVNESCESTRTLVEDSVLTEKLIQYGNRYRGKYRSVDDLLLKAEDHFRNYEYEDALSTAEAAIEKVDPQVLASLKEDVREPVNL